MCPSPATLSCLRVYNGTRQWMIPSVFKVYWALFSSLFIYIFCSCRFRSSTVAFTALQVKPHQITYSYHICIRLIINTATHLLCYCSQWRGDWYNYVATSGEWWLVDKTRHQHQQYYWISKWYMKYHDWLLIGDILCLLGWAMMHNCTVTGDWF